MKTDPVLERSNSAYGRICNKNRLCLIINVEDEEATVLVGKLLCAGRGHSEYLRELALTKFI